MGWLLAIGLISGLLAMIVPYFRHPKGFRHPEGYSVPLARVSCALWAVSLQTLCISGGYHVAEGALRTIIFVGGGMLALGAFIEIFKKRPLAPWGMSDYRDD